MTIEAEKIYEYLCKTPSDINEHLPTLKKYTEKSEHVTEMGVRFVNSTFAFLMGKPKILRCIDLFHPKKWNYDGRLNLIENYSKNNNIDFKFIVGDTLEIEIEETDLLFIDTLHTYHQLKNELLKHSNKVKKYLIFHDTELYGDKDEYNCYTDKIVKENKQGLNEAIQEFLNNNLNWKIIEKKNK